jgi:ribosomal protein S18 acetylase RimI-like enzyme
LTEPIIRPARLEDAKALHHTCYPEHPFEDVRDYLAWCLQRAERGQILRLVAEVEGQVVGNVQLTVWGRDGEVGSLVVSEAFRQQGLARRLVTAVISEAKERRLVSLEISGYDDETATLAFYERLGFSRVRTGPDPQATKNGLSHPASSRSVVLLRMLL